MNTMNTLKAKMSAKMKGGFFTGVGLSVGFLTTGLFAAAYSMNIFSPGDVISAAQINQNFAIAAPEGAVMAFYLPDCPQGWALADGTLGTPDLRGRFIRGLDSRTEAAGGNDPDGPRTMGSLQADAFQGHVMSLPNYVPSNVTSGQTVGAGKIGVDLINKTDGPISDGTNGTPRIANETRPENVALIYCMRKN